MVVYSGKTAADFIRGQGIDAASLVSEPSPRVSGGEMKGAALWYFRSWLSFRSDVPRIQTLVRDTNPDLVVCDEEFSGMEAARSAGKRRAFLSDELELGFARSWPARMLERRVYGWYRRLQAEVDLLIVPEPGEDKGNERHIGPIVREAREGRDEVKRKYGLPEGRMVLLSLSGSGLGGFLVTPAVKAVKDASLPGIFLAITGNRGKPVRSDGVFDLGLVPDNESLVAAADLVISTAGKSTIDEARAAGSPLVVIPIKNHAEQERNAAALGFAHRDVFRLAELVRERIGTRSSPVASGGAKEAADLILSLAGKG